MIFSILIFIFKLYKNFPFTETNYTFYQCATSGNGKIVEMANTTSLKVCVDYCALIGYSVVAYSINSVSLCQCIQNSSYAVTDNIMTCTEPCPNGDTSISCGGTTVYNGMPVVGSNSCK
jgi:hypothetical protein